ncbi:MAG: gliding motility-associated C-terminal domain-containing protein [Flavobacteriales bacterium]|nr:gliding motility-associated C-terminal domain-containing protein [Flavobacteriales bacterium]
MDYPFKGGGCSVRLILSIFLGFSFVAIWASEPPVARFTQNKGQWPAQVAYRTLIPGGALFVEHSALTYTLHSGGTMEQHGHEHPGPLKPEHAHAFRVTFEGALQAVPEGSDEQSFYENFFLGKDSGKWGTGCAVFGTVELKELYPGIDLRMDGSAGLKYDLIVAPGKDPAQIQLRFEGQDGLKLHDGRLFVKTTAGIVIEEAPVAYQETATGRKGVRCKYRLSGNKLTFELPDGFDPSIPLVIDPVLTFASYSGSTADNFGFTASYDEGGHLYGGGIVFGSGYPTTTGVLDPAFNGGTIDIGLTKFAPDGATLIWSTYIGGSGNECPHSLVVNANNELYMLGSTGSSDFPTGAGAFDATFNGGTDIGFNGPTWEGMSGGYGYTHANGTDIVLVHFNTAATALLGSTYVGGSGNDGVNNILPLAHNYGDHFRGEVALDGSEWPVVNTSTQSADIPVSPNAPQTTYAGGGQDAYLFRMNPSLSTLQATYYGGSGADSGYGIQFDSSGQVFTTGGTTSTDLPMPGSPFQAMNQGGADGYVARWSADLSQLLSATYMGTVAFDQSYFVQLDVEDKVYVVGQTHGAYPVSAGVYSNPGSSQFIQKLSNDLSTSEWSTVIGSGLGNEDISPSAFLVSNCGQIYFSGWGGFVNSYGQADNSTTVGLPVTADAFQPNTDGSDFYLMLLNPDAVSLNYATFFGGTSGEHVDGGTSRFDKNGTVYQAVCAGCGNNDDFPTTPGAWSNTNNSFNCNLGVFKFELAVPIPDISIDGPNTICIPGTIQFANNSTGGDTFHWNFGDGTTSTEFAPAHLYTDTGAFTVSMVMSDSYGCSLDDSTDIVVFSIAPPVAVIDPVPPICPGNGVQVQASDGVTWAWSPATGVSDPAVADPVITPLAPTTYTVIITGACGQDSASVYIDWLSPVGSAGQDTSTCIGTGIALAATGGGTYTWMPDNTLSTLNVPDPIATPADSTVYRVAITTPDGCIVNDSVLVAVFYTPPVPALSDTAVCLGGTATLTTGMAAWYQWQALPGLSSTDAQSVTVSPTEPTTYIVQLINACGTVMDSAHVGINLIEALAWPDTLVCPGEPVVLYASGGVAYNWGAAGSTSNTLLLDPAQAGIYTVVVSDAIGCSASAQAEVQLYPLGEVHAGPDVLIDWGESAVLTASGTGTFNWAPDSALSCTDCAQTHASPLVTTTYTLSGVDANGCRATDQVTVFFRGSLFVPNAFTPNGDGINEFFRAITREAKVLHLEVFNRWGELIFSTDDPEGAWDGTYKGVPSPIGVYVWQVSMTETNGDSRFARGHVTLLR